mmetsp:Transcript_8382/g.28144  ORF Transcript_8382/g.28144 Transcript_8382/m.28144 type:complete len:107 (+) Transcript_8382:59-379(+)
MFPSKPCWSLSAICGHVTIPCARHGILGFLHFLLVAPQWCSSVQLFKLILHLNYNASYPEFLPPFFLSNSLLRLCLPFSTIITAVSFPLTYITYTTVPSKAAKPIR